MTGAEIIAWSAMILGGGMVGIGAAMAHDEFSHEQLCLRFRIPCTKRFAGAAWTAAFGLGLVVIAAMVSATFGVLQ